MQSANEMISNAYFFGRERVSRKGSCKNPYGIRMGFYKHRLLHEAGATLLSVI
jgi:hypothetical protein